MNGIIHKCSHPEGPTEAPIPLTEDQMMQEVLIYLDLLVGAVKPQRLLYLAVDGQLAFPPFPPPPLLPRTDRSCRVDTQGWRRAPR